MSCVVVLETPLIGPRDSLARRIRFPLNASGNRVRSFQKVGRSLIDAGKFMIVDMIRPVKMYEAKPPKL